MRKFSLLKPLNFLGCLVAVFLSHAASAGDWIDPPFSKWIQSTIGEPITQDNSVELFVDGPEFYPALLELIRNARSSIDVAMFLWCDDSSGTEIARALLEASGRGVRVRVLNDYFNFKAHERVYDLIAHTGLPALSFNPPSWGLDQLSARMHEKMVVVDGATTWISGANFCDEYMVGGKRKLWHDLAIVARGPVANRAQIHYDQTWNWMAEEEYEVRLGYGGILESPEAAPHVYRTYPLFRATPILPLNPENTPAGDAIAMLQYQQTYMHSDDGKRYIKAYSELIKRATRRVIVYAPYFIPEAAFEKALAATARRGVDVTVITNSDGTNDLGGIAITAQNEHYRGMLAAGVHVHEVTDTTLHAKAILIDNTVLSVGSHNLTNRAFKHNGEANIMTGDARAIARFEKMAEDDLSHRTRQLTLAGVAAAEKKSRSVPHSIWRTFVSWISRLF